jgi:hypothetical protein
MPWRYVRRLLLSPAVEVACLVTVALASAAALAAAQAPSPSFALPATYGSPPAGTGDGHPPLPAMIDVGALAQLALDHAERFPAEAWELGTVAARLAGEPAAVHAFVRDHIAIDPYPGVLRGAEGALHARAGGPWDRALLLAGLLGAGFETRFALGTLDPEAADAILVAAATGAPSPLAAPSVVDLAGFDAEALLARARRDHWLLLDALGDTDRLGAATLAEASAPYREAVAHHVWVQARIGSGDWIDLDPTAPFGTSSTAPERLLEEPPEDAYQWLSISVVAESLEGGQRRERVVLEESLSAVTAEAQELWLYFEPEQGLGGAIAGMDASSGVPVLLVDDDLRRGSAFTVGSREGGGILGALGGSTDGEELVALHVDIAALAPGWPARTARRTLLDRTLPGARASGPRTVDDLAALPPDTPPSGLGGAYHLLVSTGAASPRQHALERAFAAAFIGSELLDEEAAAGLTLQAILFPLAIADRALSLVSERAIVSGLGAGGARAFIGTPRLYIGSLEPDDSISGDLSRTIDLALDSVEVILPAASEPQQAWRHRLWYGVLMSALETEAVLLQGRGLDDGTPRLFSVSTLAPDAELARIEPAALEPGERGSALHRALSTGSIAITVGDAGAFWTVDPATGATSAILEPGVRGAKVVGRARPGYNYVNASQGGTHVVQPPRAARRVPVHAPLSLRDRVRDDPRLRLTTGMDLDPAGQHVGRDDRRRSRRRPVGGGGKLRAMTRPPPHDGTPAAIRPAQNSGNASPTSAKRARRSRYHTSSEPISPAARWARTASARAAAA